MNRGHRRDDVALHDIEHHPAVPAAFVASCGGGCGHDDELEVRHDEDVLPAVTPGVEGVVAGDRTDPPAVAIFLFAPVRSGSRYERGLHPRLGHDLLAVDAAAVQIQL